MKLGTLWHTSIRPNKIGIDVAENLKARSDILQKSARNYLATLKRGRLRRYILAAASRGSASTCVEVPASVVGTDAFLDFKQWSEGQHLDVAVMTHRDMEKAGVILLSFAPLAWFPAVTCPR